MTEQKKDPSDGQDKGQDGAARTESTPEPLELADAVKTWRDPVSGKLLSCTALIEVFEPEKARYCSDIEDLAMTLNPDIEAVRSTKSLEELLRLEHTVKKYARYYDYDGHTESREFFERTGSHVSYLCAAHPEVVKDLPSKSDPGDRWAKWIEDVKKEMTASARRRKSGKEAKRGRAPIVMEATQWSQIIMEVVDDSTVKVKTGTGRWRKLTFVELGFKDERTALPNKLWGIFLSLAEQDRPIVNLPKITPKDVQRLRNTLGRAFGLPGMPIRRYDDVAKRYPCSFRFTDPRNW